MLRFKGTDNKDYTMHFYHHMEAVPANPKKEKSRAHKRPRHTTCRIKKGEEVVSEAIVTCCAKDNFSYLTGRKKSLTIALDPAMFDRETRRTAWHTMLKF